ncbi:sirohydrochlorin chelatase [Gryllotalpicola reticulitermitis]|uniref:Sirohydrochlorin chelatase n=1 Tax=Gryllotalpicola reticulitermitis TaxID=1184153 RepID=A0ABV8Q5Q5_9MICO
MIGPALLIVVEAGEDLIDDGALLVLVNAVQRAMPEVHVVPARLDVHDPGLGPAFLRELREGEPVIAVPLMLSPGARVHDDLERELGGDQSRPTVLTPAIGSDDAIVELMVRRLQRSGLSTGDVVVMAAAGSSDHHAVRESVEVGRRLAHVLERYVTVGFFTAAVPRLSIAVDTMRRLHPGSRVAVASYLLSPGRFARAMAEAGGDLVAGPLLVPGHRPPSALVSVVVERYRAGVAQLAI